MVGAAYVPVQVAHAEAGALSSALEVAGIFMPQKEMWVISETAGRILEVYKKRGDSVQEGDLLAKVDDELLQIELETVQINLDKLQKDRARLSNLIAGEAAPKSKIEEIDLGIATANAKIKGIKKQIANTSIRAPMSGTMTYRIVEKGGVIGPGIQVAQLTNITSLKLMVRVPEQEVLRIQKGLKARILPDVYPDAAFAGTVTNVGIKADKTFTYDVEITCPNPRKTPLKAGMHAKAQFDFSKKRKVGLTIPRQAVAGSLQDGIIYVLKADSTVEKRKINLGATEDDRVEVLSGLTATESIVVAGQINLNDGTRVRVVQ